MFVFLNICDLPVKLYANLNNGNVATKFRAHEPQTDQKLARLALSRHE